jgi:hypothetical protein
MRQCDFTRVVLRLQGRKHDPIRFDRRTRADVRTRVAYVAGTNRRVRLHVGRSTWGVEVLAVDGSLATTVQELAETLHLGRTLADGHAAVMVCLPRSKVVMADGELVARLYTLAGQTVYYKTLGI